MRFSVENARSAVAVVTGKVAVMRSRMWIFGSKSLLQTDNALSAVSGILKMLPSDQRRFHKSQSELNTVYNNLKTDETAKKYENFLNYTKKGIARQTEWALCRDAPISISVLKSQYRYRYFCCRYYRYLSIFSWPCKICIFGWNKKCSHLQ